MYTIFRPYGRKLSVIIRYFPSAKICSFLSVFAHQQMFFDELMPVLERVKFDVAFMHGIVSYRDILCDIVLYRIVFP